MKTMIWKELRENFKWALLALLGLTVAEFYTLSSGRSISPYQNELTLCGSAFLMVTSFGCAAIGAALGVVQILPELRRDQWAALLHRPVSRGVIFFGKVFAGLLLYFFATTLPFLASIVYVAMPGQFAVPLAPGMMLPGLSDLFLGPVFYFAAILLCLHRGRWFGSRGLLGLAVLPVFLLHLTIGWPFLLPLLAALIFLLAAWGTMLSHEVVKNRPWVMRMAFVLVMLAGAQTAWLILIFGLQSLPGKNPLETYTSFEITQDGQIFIATSKSDGSAEVLTDLNGKVVTDERYVGNSGGENYLQLSPLSLFTRGFDLRGAYQGAHPRALGNYITVAQQNYNAPEIWYLLVRQNYFIGYDKLSRRCVGIFDREGYQPPGAVPKPFPVRLPTSFESFKPRLYWSGPQMYALDFSERTMTPFFNAQNDTIYGAINLYDRANPDKPARVAVALKKEVRILDPQGGPVMSIPYGHDPAIWSDLWLAYNPASGRIYLQYEPSYWGRLLALRTTTLPAFLDEIDPQGNVLRVASCPPEDIYRPPEGRMNRLSTWSSPLLPALAGTIYHHFFPSPEFTFEMATFTYPRPSLDLAVRELAVLLVLAAVLGIVTLIWARRAGFSGRRAGCWAIFVFCFGLPGLLAFRLASDWPVRVRCPQCGRPRAIETGACAGCHQAWPLPQRNGTEIFDSMAETPAKASL